jgi:hypothetical protein
VALILHQKTGAGALLAGCPVAELTFFVRFGIGAEHGAKTLLFAGVGHHFPEFAVKNNNTDLSQHIKVPQNYGQIYGIE